MQANTTPGQSFTGKLIVSKLFESFENEARESLQYGSISFTPEKGESGDWHPDPERIADRINVLIQRYRYHRKQQLMAGEAVKRREEGHCKRIQSEAITIMTRADFYRKSQINGLGLTPERIRLEIFYKQNLAGWVQKQLIEGSPVWLHLLYIAGWGEKINYDHLEELNDKLTRLRAKTEPLIEAISIIRKPQPERDKYNWKGEVIELEPLPEWMPPTREEFNKAIEQLGEINEQIKETQREVDEELRRTTDLKKIPENFCYSIFNEGETLEADQERVNNRVWAMSRYYLEKLAAMICSYYNDVNAMEIEETRRKENVKKTLDMYTPRKKYTAEEMRELIQIGKAEGMTQKEIAKELDCNERTVRRNW